jgi:hypothetical protein
LVIDPVGFQLQTDDTGREIDDPPTVPQALRRLAQRVDGALEIDRDLAVDEGLVTIFEASQLHDAGIVDEAR